MGIFHLDTLEHILHTPVEDVEVDPFLLVLDRHQELVFELLLQIPRAGVVDAVEVMFGWQWEGRVIERFCEFTVDGREGWGVSEWHFSHKARRMHGRFQHRTC